VSELRFDGVSIGFGTGRRSLTALDRVDLAVRSARVVGPVGEFGSGKSTLTAKQSVSSRSAVAASRSTAERSGMARA
jgi:ABC-type dipeptide/oligopeptide/nickel transport system ATPase component